MNGIAIILDSVLDSATAIGTLTLAYFTCQSVRQSKNMAEVARQSIDLTKKIEKAKIKPYCTINPVPGRLGEATYGTCPKAYLEDHRTGPTLSCIIKNHGPGAARAVAIMLGGANKALWTRRIRVADVLAPGDQIEFVRQFTIDDLPSSEERAYPGTQSKDRFEGRPEYLCRNIQCAALEYTDAEKPSFTPCGCLFRELPCAASRLRSRRTLRNLRRQRLRCSFSMGYTKTTFTTVKRKK